MRTIVIFMLLNEADGAHNRFAIGTVYIQNSLFMNFANTCGEIGRLISVTFVIINWCQFMIPCCFKSCVVNVTFTAQLVLALNTVYISCWNFFICLFFTII